MDGLSQVSVVAGRRKLAIGLGFCRLEPANSRSKLIFLNSQIKTQFLSSLFWGSSSSRPLTPSAVSWSSHSWVVAPLESRLTWWVALQSITTYTSRLMVPGVSKTDLSSFLFRFTPAVRWSRLSQGLEKRYVGAPHWTTGVKHAPPPRSTNRCWVQSFPGQRGPRVSNS